MNKKNEISNNFVVDDKLDRLGNISIKTGINKLWEQLNVDKNLIKKQLRANNVHELFKQCINEVYGENSFLILEKTNGVYLLHEKDKGKFKEGRPDDRLI